MNRYAITEPGENVVKTIWYAVCLIKSDKVSPESKKSIQTWFKLAPNCAVTHLAGDVGNERAYCSLPICRKHRGSWMACSLGSVRKLP